MSASPWSRVAIAAIWVSVIVCTLAAPDLVTGPEQEHLPLVSLTAWLWGLLATLFVARKARVTVSDTAWMAAGLGVAAVWVAVTIVVLFGPVMVTGTDPTSLPLAALLAPIVGMVLTWFVVDLVVVE